MSSNTSCRIIPHNLTTPVTANLTSSQHQSSNLSNNLYEDCTAESGQDNTIFYVLLMVMAVGAIFYGTLQGQYWPCFYYPLVLPPYLWNVLNYSIIYYLEIQPFLQKRLWLYIHCSKNKVFVRTFWIYDIIYNKFKFLSQPVRNRTFRALRAHSGSKSLILNPL